MKRSMALEKWDKKFLAVAGLASGWSKDPKAEVGAVIVDTQGQGAGVGYDGFLKLVEDSVERLEKPEIKLQIVVHAEVDAIRGAGQRARGGTIYVHGRPMCASCAGPIIQSGITPSYARLHKSVRNLNGTRAGYFPSRCLRKQDLIQQHTRVHLINYGNI